MANPKKAKSKHNSYWEAVINQYNLIALGGLATLSVVTLSPIPLLAAAGFEMIYLALLPETKFFQRYIHNKYSAIDEEERQRLLEGRLDRLHPVQRRRYYEVSAIVDSTMANLEESDVMGDEVLGKLSELRNRYLGLMELLKAYESYLSSIRPNQIQDALTDVDRQIATHDSARVKQSLEERRDVLLKRQARLARVHENHAIVRTQVMTIEDIMRLIHESSMGIQNPRDIGRQIDDLLFDVEATEEAVQDLDANGTASSDDDLAEFDRELEQALQQVDQSVHVH